MATQGERMARIETLLETAAAQGADVRADIKALRAEMGLEFQAVRADIAATKAEIAADKAELAALKNKGVGLLIGVGAAGGAIGAALAKTWQSLFA